MGILSDWPPSAEDLYLPLDVARPIFQGDVFDDVPFVKVQAGESPESDPVTVIERRRVCAILYPCDIYNADGEMAEVQAVAAMVKKGPGYTIPKNWDGSYNLVPYPDLTGDGAMWFADFRSTANVDRSYLRVEKRIVSLSRLGWGYFRLRLMMSYTRSSGRLEFLMEAGDATWRELEFWQLWSKLSGSCDGFHKWWNARSSDLAGFSPNDAASKQGMRADVEQLLRAEVRR